MKILRFIYINLFTFSLCILVSTSVHAEKRSAEWCEQQWVNESIVASKKEPPDYAGLLKRWQQYGQKCAGTVAYEARLAFAYLFLDQTHKAEEILAPLKNQSSSYSNLVDLALIQVDAFRLYEKQIYEKDLRGLEAKYKGFVKKYPDTLEGYGMLGGLQTMLNEHEEAIKSLKISLRSSKNLLGVFRNLTINYSALGKHREALEAANDAIKIDKSITDDQYFMYALATTNAALGDVDAAKTALLLIAAKKPEVKEDPDFQQAVRYVIAKIEETVKQQTY